MMINVNMTLGSVAQGGGRSLRNIAGVRIKPRLWKPSVVSSRLGPNILIMEDETWD